MAAPSRELEQQAPVAAPQAREAAPVSPEHGFTPARVIALQRTAGNQAVTGLLDGANAGGLPPWLIDAGAAAAGGFLGAGGMLAGGPLGAVAGAATGAAGLLGGALGGFAGLFDGQERKDE